MPTDPNHRALLRAIDGLTTQVRRIADTLTTPVDDEADGAQTTSDDTPAWQLCTCGDTPVTAQHPETCPLSREPYASDLAEMHGTVAAEWKTTAAVYSGLHSTAEDEVKQLRAELGQLKEQLALKEKDLDELAEVARERRHAIDRVRGVRPSPPRSEFNARTNAQDEGWDQALAAVQAALIGPLAEGS
ncbi:hypothetical protein [Streptomyces anulatus]|uniref:hypothetical protein n=1 Tax=Streptomyces anulatus TaxID=1892 RepID=UPI00367A9A19